MSDHYNLETIKSPETY